MWTASHSELVHKGMSQLVAQNVRQFWGKGGQPTDGNPQLAVIQGARPRWGAGHVEEGLIAVQNHLDG